MSCDFAEEQRVAQRQRRALRAKRVAAEIAPSDESEPGAAAEIAPT